MHTMQTASKDHIQVFTLVLSDESGCAAGYLALALVILLFGINF